MDKVTHGQLLARAMGVHGLRRQHVAALMNVGERTVNNWTSGQTEPSEQEKAELRGRLGPYDRYPDLVEYAIHLSELTEDRQDTVAGYYKRHLREQREQGRESRAG